MCAYAINAKGTAYGTQISFKAENGGGGEGSNTWTNKATCPLGGNTDYNVRDVVGFSINNKGYVCGKSFLWEYNPSSNSWTQKANYTGESNWFAVGFSIGDKGYIGTGQPGNGIAAVQDFWEYTPASNKWTQKADFPGSERVEAIGFSIGNKGYIGTGADWSGYADFWEYNPASDKWTRKADFAGGPRYRAVSFSIGNKGYICTGISGYGNYYDDLWEYDPASNKWTQRANLPGESREYAVGFSIGSKGYVGTGESKSSEGGYHNSKDFWEYDPVTNKWKQKADFAGGYRNVAFGFSIGNKGYVGGGIGDYGAWDDFWEYTP